MDISLGCIWTRELKHEDALWLAVEPFAFLGESVLRKYFFYGRSITTEDGICWGEQNPDPGEERRSWPSWEVSLGVPVTVQGDPAWGKCEVEDGTSVFGNVANLGNSNTRTYVVEVDKYGLGSGNVDVYIRGSTSVFLRHAASPSWALYSGPTEQDWQYVQLRMDHSA
jgi:hypothetical protein